MALKLSENVKSYTELRSAADELLKYVAFPSLSDLIETQSTVTGLVTGNVTEDARVSEALLGSNEPIPLYEDMVKTLETAGFDQKKIVEIDKTQNSPSLQYAAINPITKGINSYLDSKTISVVYHAAQGKVDASSVLTDISAAFCSLVPPVEMSLCSPYFDVRIIYPQDASGVGKLSPLRFVGVLPNTKKVTADSSSPTDDSTTTGYEADVYEDLEKLGFDVAGMEIFCMPQTLAASSDVLNSAEAVQQRGVRILEPMMPIMTLESANIQQTGVGGTLYAQTKIDLKIVLHDRSRLSEIEALTSPEIFPTATFRIGYGWQHPDTNKMTGNVYAKLLNAMRVKQDFAVSSVSISTRDATSLSLSVSLISLGGQVSKGAKVMSASGELIPYSAVQTLLKQFVNVKNQTTKSEGKNQITTFQKVGSTIVSSTSAGTTRDKFIKIKDFYDLYSSVIEIIKGDAFLSQSSSQKIEQIVAALGEVDIDIDASMTSTEFDKVLDFGNFSGASSLVYGKQPDSNFFGSGQIQIPKALITDVDETARKSGVNAYDAWGSKYLIIPLASAIARLVAKPLLMTQPDIDEVRIHCFSFNSAAGKMSEENIGNFPIMLSDLLDKKNAEGKVVSKGVTQRTSAESVLNTLLKQVNNPASIFFGHNEAYVKRDNDVKKINESESADAEGIEEKIADARTEAANVIDKNNEDILVKKEVKFVDGAFVPPRVKAQIDVLPAYSPGSKSDPSKKIARILIYDDRSGAFNKLANLIFSMINTNGIARMSASRNALPDEFKDIEGVSDLFSAVETDTESSLQTFALSSKERFREIVSGMYPTIVIGGDTTCVTNATFTSQPSGEVASSYLLTALQGGSSGATEGASSTNDLIDDVLILPSSISLTMLGNVCMTRGQTYYVDFNTGTTLDNTYTVQTVTHSIRPGNFTTSVSLMPTNSATMRSVYRQAAELQKIIKSAS